jgi:hypothetical protein
MSFTTPTVDVYVPGTTLGIGNVNAGTINIGKSDTIVNVGGSMNVTNNVSTPSCTMTSLTTGNLIISPFSGDVAFNNFSARNATITNGIFANASINTLNSSTMLIGPYPVSGAFTNVNISNATIANGSISNLSSTNINVLNASMTYVNVSGLLINPLPTNPKFTSINSINAGYLGIGTTNPAYTLDVSGNVNITGNISTNSGGFKVVTNTGGNVPQSLLLGTSTDSNQNRFISALNNNIGIDSSMFFAMGKAASIGNQLEIFYKHIADNGANWTGHGFYGNSPMISYSNNNYIMLGRPNANMTSNNAMASGCISNANSGTIITGNSIRADALLVMSNTDTNNLINFAPSNPVLNTMKGAITSLSSSSIAYTTSSDKRRKTNIIPMKSMIDKIKNLNPTHFVWKDDGFKDDGFIAQEVHKIFPCMIGSVTTYCNTCKLSQNEIYDGSLCSCCDWENPLTKDGTNHYYTLDYGRFTPYLTKALQETIELVENQKKEIDELKDEKINLQNQLSMILQRLDAGGL